MAAGTITLPTITIPNTLAALAGPTYNISLEDDNWTAIKTALSAVSVSVAGEALVQAGKNTTEGTTTSLVETAVVTVSSLAIAVTSPMLIVASYRKTAGAANTVTVGLRLNTTTVTAPVVVTSNGNNAASGSIVWYIPPQSANYLRGTWGLAITNDTATIFNTGQAQADLPNAVITDVVIRGLVADALITLAVKNVFVYTLGA